MAEPTFWKRPTDISVSKREYGIKFVKKPCASHARFRDPGTVRRGGMLPLIVGLSPLVFGQCFLTSFLLLFQVGLNVSINIHMICHNITRVV